MLCRYLKERRIDKNIGDKYCYEIVFKFSNKEAKHTAISFKNSAGGYELRNDFLSLGCNGLAQLLADKAVMRPYYLAAWVRG